MILLESLLIIIFMVSLPYVIYLIRRISIELKELDRLEKNLDKLKKARKELNQNNKDV